MQSNINLCAEARRDPTVLSDLTFNKSQQALRHAHINNREREHVRKMLESEFCRLASPSMCFGRC